MVRLLVRLRYGYGTTLGTTKIKEYQWNEISGMFDVCSNEISGMFDVCSNEISEMFDVCSNEISGTLRIKRHTEDNNADVCTFYDG
ncbi:hypothetical protein Btru_075363 [Bulinus truncatus]|nr:hypothetical protein Btru_075363 [Bulinus truncatus]